MSAKTLRLIPVQGKYTRAYVDGREVSIWRDFEDGSEGTPLDYKTAVSILCLQPPIASLVPKIEDGEVVSQLKEDDQKLVNQALMQGQTVEVPKVEDVFTAKSAVVTGEGVSQEQLDVLLEKIEGLTAQVTSLTEENASNKKVIVGLQDRLKASEGQ